MPKLRAAMHLDTVFTFADRDVVTVYPHIVDAIKPFILRPSDRRPVSRYQEAKPFVEVVADALGVGTLRVVETGGTLTNPSASNGTAATTWWRWSRAWWWPMTATPTPTRCCARRASR